MAINRATNYLPILDEIYKREALTSPLEVDPDNVRFINANTVELFHMDVLDGMGDYSRANGFVSGSVGNVWEALALTQDRGRSFQVDAMDDEETIYMLFGKLVGEFMRRKVVPELDAYRFAKIAGTSGINSATADLTYGTTDIFALLDAAEEQLAEDEVPNEGRILYVSELAYKCLKSGVTRELNNENGYNRTILTYNGMEVRRAPKARFCTGIDLLDGTTGGETDGGYKFTSGTSKPINFMIVHPSALVTVTKHVVPRIFAPAVNQSADAWKFDYRIYHDLFVEPQKVKGVYVHKANTALAADITG